MTGAMFAASTTSINTPRNDIGLPLILQRVQLNPLTLVVARLKRFQDAIAVDLALEVRSDRRRCRGGSLDHERLDKIGRDFTNEPTRSPFLEY
jgi:hypothetical protein